jgi:uncharacterized repeat protein (TIGR03803 family)
MNLRALVSCLALLALWVVPTATSAATVTNLHNFVGPPTDGWAPTGTLCEASDGNLYGVTYYGDLAGAGSGTIYRISPANGSYAVVHVFGTIGGGTGPWGGLIQASDGYLYGTTTSGGTFNAGTIFRFSLAGSFETLYSFTGGSDGATPSAALIEASDGNLYGTTQKAGPNDTGTIFMIPVGGGVLQTLHQFGPSNRTYFVAPENALIQATDGNLYGAKFIGGTNDLGFVFRLGLGGSSYAIIYDAAYDGLSPLTPSSVIQGTDGDLYGIAIQGGNLTAYGCIFRLPLSGGAATVLHSFDGTDNATFVPLLQATDGDLRAFSVLPGGGGRIYRMALSGAIGEVTSLSAELASGNAFTLFQASNGQLYGTSNSGGTSGMGSLFGVSTVSFTVNALYDQSRAVRRGACYPIKLQVLDGDEVNVSSSSLAVHAVSVSLASTEAPGVLESVGDANPDSDFRYDAALHGYVFNLSTASLTKGTWNLTFTVGADPTVHTVQFQVK